MASTINTLKGVERGRSVVLFASDDADGAIAEASARDVADALRELGHNPEIRSLEALRSEHLEGSEVVVCCDSFPAPRWISQSDFPEQFGVKSYLLKQALKFTGSPSEATRLAKDKRACASALKAAGIPTPQLLDVHNICDADFPIILKPIRGGASNHVSMVKNRDELTNSVRVLGERRYIAQPYLSGDEFTVGVLERNGRGCALTPLKLEFDAPIFSKDLKTVGPYPSIVPMKCPAVEKLVEKAFVALGCRGYARIDLILDEYGDPHIIDVNLSPRLSRGEYFAISGRHSGIAYVELVAGIVNGAT
tara:strand:- start:12055 stop:12975 length:921 start_codon:yes stop_codon:yes gene_type:complete